MTFSPAGTGLHIPDPLDVPTPASAWSGPAKLILNVRREFVLHEMMNTLPQIIQVPSLTVHRLNLVVDLSKREAAIYPPPHRNHHVLCVPVFDYAFIGIPYYCTVLKHNACARVDSNCLLYFSRPSHRRNPPAY